jgi:hypothetical protein
MSVNEAFEKLDCGSGEKPCIRQNDTYGKLCYRHLEKMSATVILRNREILLRAEKAEAKVEELGKELLSFWKGS